jgi:hypothetical protein
MDDFIDRMTDKIKQTDILRKQEQEQANTESAAFVEREKLKRNLAPDLWETLRQAIASKCLAVNEKAGREYYRVHDELPSKLHVIRISPVANLRLEFFPDGNRIHFDSGECVGEYLIGIDSATGQAVLRDCYQRDFEIESTAEHLLEDCLEKAPL